MALHAPALPSSYVGAPSDTIITGAGFSNENMYNVKGNGSSEARRWLEAQRPSGKSQQADDNQPFFDFEPQVDAGSPFAPQYPSLPDADLTPGWNAPAPQMPSPPHSATSPPPSWPLYQYQQQQAVHNILTDIYPDTRVQYGQNTPPDEGFNDLFANGEESHDPADTNKQSAGEKKRKRASTSIDLKTSSPKRSRKYGRSVGSTNAQPASSAEEVRRHKFLERNRIAASKCRQKKKEWTQNLENRARELQKENQQLRMMMDSLRDEMLFLKSEMLKHTTCECEEIQGWVKSSAGSRALSPMIKTEHSPINSAPSSRRGSFSSHYQEPSSPDMGVSRGPESPEMRNLEGLLLDRLVHDTSDRGIATNLQAAA